MSTDVELLHLTAQGERAALAGLVRRYHATLLRFARGLVGQDADDIVQTAFLDAWRGAKTFEGRSSVKAWLLTLVRHAAYRSRRLRAGEPRQHEPLDVLGVHAGWGSDPETDATTRLTAQAVHEAIDRLPLEAREVLLLRDLEDLPGREVARLLELSLSAMKSRLHRARLLLAAELRKDSTHGA